MLSDHFEFQPWKFTDCARWLKTAELGDKKPVLAALKPISWQLHRGLEKFRAEFVSDFFGEGVREGTVRLAGSVVLVFLIVLLDSSKQRPRQPWSMSSATAAANAATS